MLLKIPSLLSWLILICSNYPLLSSWPPAPSLGRIPYFRLPCRCYPFPPLLPCPHHQREMAVAVAKASWGKWDPRARLCNMVALDHAAGLCEIATGSNVQWSGDVLLSLERCGREGSNNVGDGPHEWVGDDLGDDYCHLGVMMHHCHWLSFSR